MFDKIKSEVEKLGKSIETKERPAVLYHASNKPDLEELDPTYNFKSRSVKDGSVIFATPNYSVATLFLVPTDDSWANSGSINDNWYFICNDKDRFTSLDTGGIIYTLPSDSFSYDPNIGLGEDEWTTKEKVKPIDKKIIPKALDEMIKNNIRVYFVDSDLYQKFISANNEEIYKNILNDSESENQKRGLVLSKII